MAASAMFQFRVFIHNEEDEVVRDYFRNLEQIFTEVVALSAFAFDTPFTESEFHQVPEA